MSPKTLLIAGAGPTGLAAALLLHGTPDLAVQLIEQRPQPSPFSRAFGVNARTLTLLESTGATELFLQNGRRMPALNLYLGRRHLARVDFAGVRTRYPFMLVQSQAESEAILTQLLADRGLPVQRSRELLGLAPVSDQVVATVRDPQGAVGTITADRVFAADGARSTARTSLGLAFPGDTLPDAWRLYDVALQVALPEDEAHAFILDDGALFMVRLAGTTWRVLGNVPDLLNRLPAGTQVGAVRWQSEFAIAHRVIEQFSAGRVHFGGDAAHVHAGIGARGLNLGIEDAYVFARCYRAGQLDRYHAARHPLVTATVARIHRQMDLMRGHGLGARLLRLVGGAVVPRVFPLVARRLAAATLGLDHAL